MRNNMAIREVTKNKYDDQIFSEYHSYISKNYEIISLYATGGRISIDPKGKES